MSPPGRRSAPGREAEDAPESFAGDDTSIDRGRGESRFRIAGRIVVDARTSARWVSFDEDQRISRAIQELEYAPAGADATVVVSAGQHPSLALDYLRAHAPHLGSLTVECSDARTVGRWVRGLRDGVAVEFR